MQKLTGFLHACGIGDRWPAAQASAILPAEEKMGYMIGVGVAFASVVTTATLTGWSLFAGLRRGVIYSQRVAYSRTDDPSSFWFYASCYACAFAASGGLLAFFAFEAIFR